MSCDKCGSNEPTRGAVFNAKYGQYCAKCRLEFSRQQDPSSAAANRDAERQAHERDMLQPRINGHPSKEFIREYPESAKEMFTKEELKEYQ